MLNVRALRRHIHSIPPQYPRLNLDTHCHLLGCHKLIMAPSTLTVTLQNQKTSNTVFAHITGILVNNGVICFMKSVAKYLIISQAQKQTSSP
jgi:hypothetical protein